MSPPPDEQEHEDDDHHDDREQPQESHEAAALVDVVGERPAQALAQGGPLRRALGGFRHRGIVADRPGARRSR